MATLTVRVVPRAGRRELDVTPDGVVVRVRSVPEEGRATAEAGRLIAETLGVAPTRVRLRTGARSRLKTFEVDGLSDRDLRERLARGA